MTALRQPPFLPALAAAAALHAAALGWLALRAPAPPTPPRRAPAIVRLAVRPPPPPPPPAPAAEPPRNPPSQAAPPRREPRPPRVARLDPRPAEPAPKASAEPPASPAPTRRFAVSMDATVPGGGVAVPVTPGPTAPRGDPRAPASAPVGDDPAPAAADATDVEEAARPVSQPSPEKLRALYPEAARREGVEGDVRLELLVNERGEVDQVRIVQRGGHGFDEVAAQLRSAFRFKPARRQGRPVAVWVPWTVKFRLDG